MTRIVGLPALLFAVGLGLAGSGKTSAQPAPVRVNEPQVCFDCHPDVETQTSSPHVHEAFGDGTCSSCHNPHASKHSALLAESQAELCLSCHGDVEAETAQISGHEPAANGACGSCHDPHASDHAALLDAELQTVCEGCHTHAAEWREQVTIHAPVEDGDCLTCHTAHGSSHGRLLQTAVPALCFDCHDADASFASVHGGEAVSGSNCTACHDPHAGPLPGLVRANQHAPFASGNCATCHGQEETRQGFTVTVGIQELCTKCHRGILDFEKQPYRHNLEDERSCKQCHNPHASNVSQLLIARQEILCVRCHFTEASLEEGRSRADYMTHPGVDCSECHVPHGSENERYLRTLDEELCARCHQRAHVTSHPVGEDVIDARTETPMTCLSCHQLHGAPFEKYLPLDPTMDLCIQCHQR